MLTKRKKRMRNFTKKLKYTDQDIISLYIGFVLIALRLTENTVLCRASLIDSNHLSFTGDLIVKM